MLAYLLALIVAFGSLAIYLSAFLFPEIHRQNDFIWSGVGLFYALVLWIFTPRITGGLLLGHVASVALLVWSVSQTLSLRRQLAPAGQQTPLPSPELIKVSFQEQMSKFSVKEKFGQLLSFVASVFGGAKAKIQQTVNKKPVIKTAAEILRTNGTEATPPSVLPDESVTATPAMTTETSSEETFAQSSMLEVVQATPTPPTVIEEERVIPPTAPETMVEITQTEVVISESSITGETETVVEITQTEVVIAREETSEMASAPEVSSPNSVTSELLAAEAAEKSDLTVEEVKPVGEALPEQIPFNKPVEE
ncbi:Ycf66 family protein [Aphanizomenon sp. CS-733/32]|uniref:Ycf66 family protein n=1 Tax=Aphanizomenon sp. CS-733/32 TaxID=3021715 RepID=UPI00232BB33E|nr:Ycf66 family protein [Aphanizomenon sp. CS-733/32]MDB9309677.1 Ycf66 family protein [Aphanizomenon sp. CS-733/32]